MISFTVIGTPVPQGSKRHVGHGVMVEANKALPSWRDSVVTAARAVAPAEPLAGPVRVVLDFRFLPVASAPYRTRHVSAPDVDKLARAVLDALTIARVVVDDARVWDLHANKRYCEPSEAPGVGVVVEDTSEAEAIGREWKKEAAACARKAAKAAS